MSKARCMFIWLLRTADDKRRAAVVAPSADLAKLQAVMADSQEWRRAEAYKLAPCRTTMTPRVLVMEGKANDGY